MTLPIYEVFIDGKPRRIELTKTGEKAFTVKIDDKPVKAELIDDASELDEVFTLKIGNKKYRIEMPKIDRDKPFQIKVDEAAFKVEVRFPQRQASVTAFTPTSVTVPARKAAATKEAVEGEITAPMTGKILSVKVKKGDQVKAGQVVCVIEAMKMENEIAAPKAGTVREVHVSAGSSVNEGEALVVVD